MGLLNRIIIVMMLQRRLLLGGLATLLFSSRSSAQERPKLIILGSRASGEVMNYWRSYTGKSLEGWLVCNGAEVDRQNFRELFAQLGTRAGTGDGVSTFNLPSFPLETKEGKLLRGTAICPSWEFGAPAGSTMPFSIDQLRADDGK